jgi:glycosyltransferase involved in cell wall biosynthesis
MPRLSVVIPTLGRRPEALARVVAALPDGVEVIVAADAAAGDDVSTETVRGARPGAAAARNAGWRAAGAPLVLFLDDDVVPGPALVASHLAVHDREPGDEVAVLGHVRWAPELRVTPFMRWLERGPQFHFVSIPAGGEAGWGHLYTANVSFKRAALEAVDGFDEEAFPFHYEDLDLGRRLADGPGLRLLYARDAIADHLHAVTLDEYAARVAGIAPAERRFVERYPDVEPYFHDMFTEAATIPPGRGWGARLAPFVPERVPLLGPAVHERASLFYRQRLAPAFLEAWESP